ncbi:MAG: 30S ribosomal protein S27ae [Candidatus Marsarchaeota archaeon]|jgi:SSU ribosomal protein S27AE|nr:30S ribosomal protein S27ae [Candidatus Marsarchaeota archaeon]MCL5094982.1 30S ribosomal protein S27ae [Candidatus Marsarchaeota archaeon]
MADDKKSKPKAKNIKPFKAGKSCPKCGSRMAEHENRFSCGKCSYTEFKNNKK